MPMPAVVEALAPVLCWIVPPVPAAPSPLTTRLPFAAAVPVLSSELPTPLVPAAVPAVMLRKVRPPAPIVVLATLSAVPDPLLMVLGLVPVVTVIVPPLQGVGEQVALKPAPLVVS